VRELEEVEAAAQPRGIETIALKIRSAGDVAPAFEELSDRADALYVVGEAVTSTNSARINTFALAARLPTSYNNIDRLDPGGFMSYGPHFPSLYRRAAEMVDRILRGTKPADIPVEQPTRYDLVFNLTTAKALRLKVPESLLLRADKLIE
jgi:putative tryptophan/tyrosine transport system substrate-binding protein